MPITVHACHQNLIKNLSHFFDGSYLSSASLEQNQSSTFQPVLNSSILHSYPERGRSPQKNSSMVDIYLLDFKYTETSFDTCRAWMVEIPTVRRPRIAFLLKG